MKWSSHKIWWGCIVVLALIQGCSAPASPDSKTPEQQPAQQLTIRLDSLFRIPAETLSGIALYYQSPGSENIYFLDPEQFQLYALHTGKGTLKRLCPIDPTESINGFTVDERSRQLHVFVEDSLFSYNLQDGSRRTTCLRGLSKEGFLAVANRAFLPLLKNGHLYMNYFPDIDSAYRNPAFFRGAIEAKVNLRTGKVTRLAARYPKNFQEYCYSYNYVPDRIQLNRHTHAYCFPYNDSVFIYDFRRHTRKAHYFGTRLPKTFRHVRFDEIAGLHHTVFDELVETNPYYLFTADQPLAGYYTRQILISDPERPASGRKLRVLIYNRHFQYVGESRSSFRPNIVADSKKGLISLSLIDNVLYVNRWLW